jgi:glycosyltransferase involved in cell wall biosynthesis
MKTVARSPSSPVRRDLLLDVSRLIWRTWRGRPATGIDRVCLAYVRHFQGRAQAVVQRRGARFVISPRHSDKLFELLTRPGPSRGALSLCLARCFLSARRSPEAGMIYLNVGHTGLDEPSLPAWVSSRGLRAVYLIHDLIPITNPEFCRPLEAAKHEQRMANALTSASGIIANSSETLDELTAFARSLGVPMAPALVSWIAGDTPQARPRRVPLDRPYFVAVGTIEARKNHRMLLDAWQDLVERLGADAPVLVIIGQRGWEAEETFRRLDSLGLLSAYVRETSDCEDEELAGWIAGSRALLMPSFAEGFGLPVVEALALGTPVIASDLPVYREIVGDIPTYLDPTDRISWARTIQDFLGNGSERERQLKRISNFKPPRWEDHFRFMEQWLAELQGCGRNAA